MEKQPRSKNKKLSMEDYLECFNHRLFEVLTYTQINQILAIHGFRQFKNEQKKVIVDAVRTIDLMDLKRSTTRNDDVSPAILTLNEVIRDLKSLKWDECHVSSLVTQCAPDSASVSKTSNGDDVEKAVVVVPVKRRKAVKKPKVICAADVSSVASTCTAMVVVKGKRSKRVKREVFGGFGGGGVDDCFSGVVSAGAIVVARGASNDTRTSFFF